MVAVVAVVAVVAFPVILIHQVPDAQTHVRVGVYELKLSLARSVFHEVQEFHPLTS